MKCESKLVLVAAVLLGAWNGCVTAAPAQLAAARDTYARLCQGTTAKSAQAELLDAGQSLVRANDEFIAHGDSTDCRDLSYVAQNKLELAEVTGRTELERQRITQEFGPEAAVREIPTKDAESCGNGLVGVAEARKRTSPPSGR
jgi:Domain of unknown function (DUF4398)